MLYRAAGRSHRQGLVLVWVVLSFGVLLGVLALGMDGGRVFEERRRAQAAADAAALAAADDLYANYSTNQGTDPNGTAKAAALQSAAANGYDNDGTQSIVTVNIPPQSGTFAGEAEYAEVIVQSNLPGTFCKAFTSDPVVLARGVARGRPKPLGLISLSASDSPGLSLTGSMTVQVTGVGAAVKVNSTANGAVQLGLGTTLSTPSLQVRQSVLAGLLAWLLGTLLGPVTGVANPIADPLQNLPLPNSSDYPQRCISQMVISGNSVVTLQPGTYTGGLSITDNAQVTMQPGIYVMDGGGFSVTLNGAFTANGVFLYNTGGATAGPIVLNTSQSISWTAPSSGTYTGIIIAQDPGVSQGLQIAGSADVTFQGAIYAPGAQVQLNGNGLLGPRRKAKCHGGLIGKILRFSGNATVTVDPGALRPKVPDIAVVE
jgi:Flp pilus assembly protein TadG